MHKPVTEVIFGIWLSDNPAVALQNKYGSYFSDELDHLFQWSKFPNKKSLLMLHKFLKK